MNADMERFAARGEYEEIKEKETDLRVCLRSHVQALHVAMPLPEINSDLRELSTNTAEILLSNISRIKGELNTVLVRKKTIQEKWYFGRACR